MKRILYILLCFLLLQCSQNDEKYEMAADAALVNMLPESSGQHLSDQKELSLKNTDSISKKIIKNGEIGVKVSNISTVQKKIDELIKINKGYVQSESLLNGETSNHLNLVIRVPHQNFDALINSLSSEIGEMAGKSIQAEDVTEEYTNISIKMENKLIYLQKYRDMLKGAITTKDMLDIQEKIRALEDEIDIAEGRLRFIDDRVNYSTLKLDLYQEKPRSSATSKIGFGSRFWDSLATGWNTFIGFLLGLVSFWPFIAILPFIIYGVRKWRNRKR